MGAVTFPANVASIGLLKKNGFMEEGKLRSYLFQNGQSHDALVFSMLHRNGILNEYKIFQVLCTDFCVEAFLYEPLFDTPLQISVRMVN